MNRYSAFTAIRRLGLPGLFGVLLGTALGAPLASLAFAQPAQEVGNRQPEALVFGAKIIDLDLTLDDAAEKSLEAAPDKDVPASMTFKDAHGTDDTYSVRIHRKGQAGSTRPIDGKPAWKISLSNGDRFFGLEHLTLNNMVQDPTMLHEALGYPVYAAVGVIVPRSGYVRLTINGQPYGLYLNLETLDRNFLKRRFGDDNGILYEGAYGVDLHVTDVDKFELDEGVDRDRMALKELVRAIDVPGDDVFYGKNALVDIDSFLSLNAAGALLSDWDNYYSANNYRIYWNRSARRWLFIPTGIDQTFMERTVDVFGSRGLLFQKCLASERCTTEYVDKVREVANRFESLNLPATMDAWLTVIDPAVEADPKKSYKVPMTTARDELRAFIARRPTEVRAALSCLDTGGHEATFAACAGAVAMNLTADQCAQIPSDKAKEDEIPVGMSSCRGGPNQRWRLIPRGNAFALVGVMTGKCLDVKDAGPLDGAPLQQRPCAPVESQLFALHPIGQGKQLTATHSGKCVAIASGPAKSAPLIQASCADDPAQTWLIQRSIYK